jgi:transcriptional regulator
MYLPKQFAVTDERALYDFIDAHAFGSLLTAPAGRPFASHVPFLLDRAQRRLHCHVARANPQWQQVAESPSVLAIFMGPHGYISPTWYPEPGVPTWNYTAVHVYGRARCIDDAVQTRHHVEALASKFESFSASPWVPDYDPRRLGGIVGITIEIDELEGKFKLSQHRSAAEHERVVAALVASGRESDAELAAAMQKARAAVPAT